MKYSFTCPLGECGETMTTEAEDNEMAAEKLTEDAKQHLAAVHPDIKKTDQEVHNDIRSHMRSEEQGEE